MNQKILIFLIVFLMGVLFYGSQIFAQCTPANSCEDYCSDPCREDPNTGNWIGKNPPSGVTCICSPIKYQRIQDLIEGITNWVFDIAIILAPLMIIIGGILFITAGGSAEKIKTAKKLIFWTVIGFLIVLFSKGIVNLINYILGR